MKKIMVIILTLVIVFVFSACGITTEFQCSAVVKIENSSDVFSIIYNDTYTNLLKSNTSIAKISENLDFEISDWELENSIVLEDIDRHGTFEIIVSHTYKETAKQILNAILEEYPLILKEYSSDLNFVIVSKSTDDGSE